jgi:hypothetical protein
MKKIILLITACIALLSYSCSQTPKQAKITFEKDTLNFEVKKGQIFTTSFKFRNIGSDTLKIKNVEVGCGCTIADFPKSIAPNSSSEIKIKFDSKEKKDKQILQAIVVESNTKPILHILYLKATIL